MQPRCWILLHYQSRGGSSIPLIVYVYMYVCIFGTLVGMENDIWTSPASHHADKTSIPGLSFQPPCRWDIYTWSLFAAPFSTLKVEETISGSNVGGEREIHFPAFWSPKEHPVGSSSHIRQYRAVFHSEGQGTAVLVLRWPRASLRWRQHR